MKNNERNYYIDFLKFIFSIIIVFYHSWLFTGSFGDGYFNRGFYAVDFYFIVTGFLFINSVEKLTKKKSKENIGLLNIKFVFNKIKQILPNILFIFIIGYLLVYRTSSLDYHKLFSDSTITEFLFSGFLNQGMLINKSCWYISVMIIVLFILFPLAYKFKKNYNYLIAPLIIIITLGICNYFQIDINDPLGSDFIFINGFYKGIIFINLGVIAYEICNYIKKKHLTHTIGFTVIETCIYIFLIANMQFDICGSYLIAILFLIGISITFSNTSYSSKLFTSPIFQQLGKFGFILYLTNIPVRTFLLEKYQAPYNEMVIIYLEITIALSILSFIFSELVFPKYLEKRKKRKILNQKNA